MVNWDKYNNDKVSKLSFEGETIECKVVKVYDGDTITVVFPLKYKVKGIPILGQMYKWNCRLIGIDTPVSLLTFMYVPYPRRAVYAQNFYNI